MSVQPASQSVLKGYPNEWDLPTDAEDLAALSNTEVVVCASVEYMSSPRIGKIQRYFDPQRTFVVIGREQSACEEGREGEGDKAKQLEYRKGKLSQ